MNVCPVDDHLPTAMPGSVLHAEPLGRGRGALLGERGRGLCRGPGSRAALSTRARLDAPFGRRTTSTTTVRAGSSRPMSTQATTVDWTGQGTRPLTSPAIRSIGWAGGAAMPAIQDPRWAGPRRCRRQRRRCADGQPDQQGIAEAHCLYGSVHSQLHPPSVGSSGAAGSRRVSAGACQRLLVSFSPSACSMEVRPIWTGMPGRPPTLIRNFPRPGGSTSSAAGVPGGRVLPGDELLLLLPGQRDRCGQQRHLGGRAGRRR